MGSNAANYLEVKYEDLLRSPEDTLNKIIFFIGSKGKGIKTNDILGSIKNQKPDVPKNKPLFNFNKIDKDNFNKIMIEKGYDIY
jgi:hypothetical protein